MENKVPLTKEMIDRIFNESSSIDDYIIKLYKVAIPEWDSVKSINGYPVVNQITSLYIFEKAIAFDKIHYQKVLNGGSWMNPVFSSNDSESLEDWVIDNKNVKLKMEIQETHDQKMNKLINLLEVNGCIQELEILYTKYCNEYELWEEDKIDLVIPCPRLRLANSIYDYIKLYQHTDFDLNICYDISDEFINMVNVNI